MNLIKEYKKSITHKVVSFLIDSNFEFKFKNSIFSKIFVFENSKIAKVAIILAILFYWYEGIITPYFNNPIFEILSPVLVLVSFYFVPKKEIIFKKFHVWYLLFLISSLISGLLAVYNGLDARMILFGWFFFLQFFLAIIIGQSIKINKLFSKAIIALAVPNVIYGLYQILVNPNAGWSFSYLESMGARASGLFGGPNVFAFTCIIALLLSIYLFLEKKHKLFLVTSLLFTFGIIFSFSRAGWLAVVVAVFYMVYRFKPSLLKFTPFTLLILFISRVRERIFVVFSESYRFDSSIDGRIWSFNNAFYIFSKKPLLGYGPGTYGGKLASSFGSPVYLESMQSGYTALYTTDNQFTEILVQTGLLGFVGYLLSITSLFVELIKRKGAFNIVATSLLFAWVIAGMFSNILEFNAITVPVALIFGMSMEDNK